ncbi:MAG TPA: ATP synthase F1 subunit gamma, partial [Acidimicrobiia bacterium]|nr:ATP synthase F1 subunit gamma [Acidimicrobiia bacterium]
MASAELRDTRRRISSVEAIKKITRAMELIATSRIPKAIARVEGSKPYTAKLIEVIENVGGASADASHMLLERRDVTTVGVLVFASDRGMAGAYSSNVIRLAEHRIADLEKANRDVLIYAVGKKAQSYFRYRGYLIEQAYLGVTDTPGYNNARAVASTVMEAYASKRIDALEAFYTRFHSAITQTPTSTEVLPITPPERAEGDGPSVSYEFEPEPGEILDRLLPRYVEAVIFNMLLEASA